MEKIKGFLKDEKGNVLIIFAGSIILMAFFIGLIIDVSMIYMDNNSMQNLLQIIREERFTHQDTIRYAEDPALETYKLVHDSARKNGFNGKIKMYFKEEERDRDTSFRSYRVRIVLEDESDFYFGRLFGLDTISLSAKLDGGESYGDGSTDVIWYPPGDVSDYNGSYFGDRGSDRDDPVHNKSEDTPPGGW